MMRSVLALVCLLAASSAHAASDWVREGAAQARLIAGTPAEDGTLRAGLEIRLEPGWKTYWRMPGDSGVPPRFDFAGSENLAHADIRWPLPRRFTDGGGTTIGYAGSVVFPLKLAPQDASKPVRLKLVVDYAVCERVCVPVQARFSLALDRGAKTDALASLQISGFEQRVPRPAEIGAAGPLAITGATLGSHDGRKVVMVEARLPADAKTQDLVAAGLDGAEPGVPHLVQRTADGKALWRVPLVPGREAGRVLLVASADDAAIATQVGLDGLPAAP